MLLDIQNLNYITEGGEGIIYSYKDNIVKQYKPHVNIAEKKQKIQALINAALPLCVIAPTDVVYDSNGKFIGYIMPRVKGEDFKKLSNKKYVTATGITTKDILKMLIDIKNTLDVLHKQDIYVGDLNDQNILFNANTNDVYFIDTDSWSVAGIDCTVAMDLFKDPKLQGSNFDASTDNYAFAVLAWKALTRIHPFGGTMSPDINILERMQKGLSIINNNRVTIPRAAKNWDILSPELISRFESIFNNTSREFSNELLYLYDNLSFCDRCNDYYYSKYTSCPICDKNAKIQLKPECKGIVDNSLRIIPVLDSKYVSLVLNGSVYVDNNNQVVSMRYNQNIIGFDSNYKYHFMDFAAILEDSDSFYIGKNSLTESFEKKEKTNIVVRDNHIFYIGRKNEFVDMEVSSYWNSKKKLCQCSAHAYFDVYISDKLHYCIVNYYEKKIIINVDGWNNSIDYDGKIINYGIHFDKKTNGWLVILENEKGKFLTIVIGQKNDSYNILYKTDEIKYQCSLNNVCINGNIFIPIDGKIRGYSYQKNAFKDFECSIVDGNSKLLKDKYFVVINDENIYEVKPE